MRSITAALLCLIPSFLCLPLTAESLTIPKDSAKLIKTIQQKLPAGWKVSYLPANRWIEVVRNKPVRMEREHLPNESPPTALSEQLTLKQFSFALSIEPWTSPDDYKTRKAHNEAIQKQLSELSGPMLSITHKFDSYLPKTPEEIAQVKKYDELKAQLHSLPDFCFRHLSLSSVIPGFRMWGNGNLENNAARVVEPEPRKECAAVIKNVLSILTPYEPSVNKPPEG